LNSVYLFSFIGKNSFNGSFRADSDIDFGHVRSVGRLALLVVHGVTGLLVGGRRTVDELAGLLHLDFTVNLVFVFHILHHLNFVLQRNRQTSFFLFHGKMQTRNVMLSCLIEILEMFQTKHVCLFVSLLKCNIQKKFDTIIFTTLFWQNK